MVGMFADPHLVEYLGVGGASNLPGKAGVVHGSWTLLRWQAETAAWVIVFSGIMTFILLKIVGIFVPLRLSDEELEIGDHAIHGNEVYPSDVPTLGGPHAPSWQPAQPGRARRRRPQAGGHGCPRVRHPKVSDPALGGVAAVRLVSQAYRAAHAGAAEAAVAARVLRQVLLVVVLGIVERVRLGDLRRDLAVAGRVSISW